MVYERHEEILSYLAEERAISIDKLAKHLYVSGATVRRDLNQLEKRGLVKKVHGGVVLTKFLNDNLPEDIRGRENHQLKEIIAQIAAKFLFDGAAVILDGSTTVKMLTPHFNIYKNLTVFTNNLEIIREVSNPNIKVYCTGGQYLYKNKVFVGYQAETMLKNHYADLLFFSAQGFSEDGEITDSSEIESALRRVMLTRARKKIFMCDHTKLNKKFMCMICNSADVDHVICDIDLPETFTRECPEQHV